MVFGKYKKNKKVLIPFLILLLDDCTNQSPRTYV